MPNSAYTLHITPRTETARACSVTFLLKNYELRSQHHLTPVIPVTTGIHVEWCAMFKIDPRLRGNDELYTLTAYF